MAKRPDGGKRYEHDIEGGFTAVPNSVLLDPALSGNAKATYALLSHNAWSGEEPDLDALAPLLGARRGETVRGYIKELEDAGLVSTRRRGQGKPMQYLIHLPPTSVKTQVKNPDNPVSRTRKNQALRAGASGRGVKQDSRKTDPPHPPPPIVLTDKGRNLPMDALAAVCGVDRDSPRFTQVVVAINGTERGKDPEGIRHLFWREMCRWAVDNDRTVEQVYERITDPPLRFAEALADQITRKAELYRRRYRDAALSPPALRNHWLDLELVTAGSSAGDRNLTADEIASLGDPD